MSAVMEPPKQNAAADYINQIFNLIKAKNPAEPEFHQAVMEVLEGDVHVIEAVSAIGRQVDHLLTTAAAEALLRAAGIEAVAHLSGHDANELAERTGVDAARLDAWIDVADLQEEVGVPLDAAGALVAAGIRGPRGLRETEAEDAAARAGLPLQDVKRWKRRA